MSHFRSLLHVGLAYLKGEGVPQSDAEAAKWLQKAADQEETDAQERLGYLYENGWGVPLDYERAAKWYLSAAAAGHEEAKKQYRAIH